MDSAWTNCIAAADSSAGEDARRDRRRAVGIARDIEPVAGPALTVVGRGEQAFHDRREGIGRWITHKCFDFPPWWEAAPSDQTSHGELKRDDPQPGWAATLPAGDQPE